MLPRPAWALAAVAEASRNRKQQMEKRRRAEGCFFIILAIPHEFVDIQTFE
jgi:hypothetical protein